MHELSIALGIIDAACEEADVRLCGAIAEIDADTGKAISMQRVEAEAGNAEQAYDADDAKPQRHGGDAGG